MPDLNFSIESADVLEFAAVPSLRFKLRIENRSGEPVRSVTLGAQIRISANQRPYTSEEKERLWEVFGPTPLWGAAQQSLLWTHATVLVPAFTESIAVDVAVPCTYDFEVTSAKYFHNLEGGEIPLEFLFSGTIFYAGERGLQVVQISWEKEAQFRMPVRLWQQMMEHYFPHSAWLRLDKEVFDRLYRYKMRRGVPTWDDALVGLLRTAEEAEGEGS
jgi:hypothetical protein